MVKTCELDEKNLLPYLPMACNGVDAYMNAYKSSTASKLNKYRLMVDWKVRIMKRVRKYLGHTVKKAKQNHEISVPTLVAPIVSAMLCR